MLQVDHINKTFDKKNVVNGISFSVNKGEAFGLLGPNGAGKSTTIAMICGLLPYDSGEILVGGVSVKKEPLAIKKKIGIVPQEIALYPTMSARNNLLFWGRMYGLTRAEAKQRSDIVLEMVGLQDKATQKIETFSGGMKRRINIGAALMHEPELLIMDEPTVGIDPQSRHHILDTVKQLNKQGMTIIYTSHYMEEVEFLCDRIGIIDQGKMIAIGLKSDLCNRLAGGIVISLQVDGLNKGLVEKLESMAGVNQVITHPELDSLDLFVDNDPNIVGDIIASTAQANVQVMSLERKEPNLERLFLHLTGRSLRD